jgi:hypothetical protein
MKVKELIELLKLHDPEDEVIMSKDSEGNYFSPLSDIELVIYVPDSTWSGSTYVREITESMKKQGFTEEDDLYHDDDGVNAIVFYPTN